MRMGHDEVLRMEHHACRIQLGIIRVGFPAVHFVAENEVTEEFQVDADLVRPAGMNDTPDQGRLTAEGFDHLPVGVGIAPAVFRLEDRHLVTVLLVPPDRLANAAAQEARCPFDECKVFFAQSALGKLGAECAVGRIGFRHQHDARSLTIQPMNDSRAFDSAYSAEGSSAMRKKCMNQGVLARPRPRMHDHPRGFVDREEVFVLKEDLQRDIHRPQLHRLHGRKRDRKGIARENRAILGDDCVSHEDQSRFERALHRHAAVLRIG